MLPSADRATSASAASSIVTPSRDVTAADLIADERRRQRLQLEDLRPRLDRLRHVLRIRRRHHELDVRRRLFDRFQQRVEGALRQAVDFVDDEDLEAIAHRRDRQRLDDDLAHGIDAGVGGAVDLEDVDVAALRDLDAGVALAARLGRRSLFAIQRPREDPRRGRLPDAARARKDKGLRETPRRDGVLQRLDDAALADDVIEPLRAPFSGEGDVGHEGGFWHATDRGPEGLRHSTGSTERCCLPALTRFVG